jgi:hypothetical protein
MSNAREQKQRRYAIGNFVISDANRVRRAVTELKLAAFASNRDAKNSSGDERAIHYRRKDMAMNALLRMGAARVDETDWNRDDPVIGLRFAGGGKLHMKVSSLDLHAMRVVRFQLTAT